MRKVLKVSSLGILGLAVVAVLVSANAEKAQARPPFAGIFAAKYENLAEDVKKVKCGVCHPEKDKKVRNAYGTALGKAIGKKNEKDKDKVAEAMAKIEKEKSAIDGKTFGDLIKDGKLPGSAE